MTLLARKPRTCSAQDHRLEQAVSHYQETTDHVTDAALKNVGPVPITDFEVQLYEATRRLGSKAPMNKAASDAVSALAESLRKRA